NRPFVPEKMNILRSAICATGIDWSRHSTQRCERFFYDTTATSQIPP
ncbi:hypothetical protein CBJ99_003427, partial [Salmonella enterica subsp. enterica serovar Elisabethville]|nr:hypothetical protein [Salmonella enterica subsp. enterica serovar Elisabethville]EDX8908776.1 hypothetical protein [Salmonella enterica subsp. enterica serovar Elisabethville]